MKKGQRPPIKETAHDAGFSGLSFDGGAVGAPSTPPGAPTHAAGTPPLEYPEAAKVGRPRGRTRLTHSVSLDNAAYDRIMRAVTAEGLEFSAFMEKAGLRLVDVLEEKRGSPYPPMSRPKNVLDDL